MIHLAITFDQNLYVQLYALLSSIINNNKKNNITLHCIATGLENQQFNELENYVNQHNINIIFYKVDEQLINKFYISNTKSFTAAVYYRLFFPVLIDQSVKRILYIDIDTLVLKDLSKLYFTDLGGYILGAVYDNYVKTQPLIGIDKEGQYFNSGVLLIDIELWNQNHITQKCVDYLLAFPKKIIYVDQCVLNAIFQSNYKQLDKYNNYLYSYIPEKASYNEMKGIKNSITIIHYTLHKPWNMLCQNPFRYLYKQYLKKSPKKNEKVILDFSFKNIYIYVKIKILNLYLYHNIVKPTNYNIKKL